MSEKTLRTTVEYIGFETLKSTVKRIEHWTGSPRAASVGAEEGAANSH
jgi:hypothetical protein